MKLATALLISSATGHASAGGPVADPAPSAPAAAAAAPDATEDRPRDPGSNLRGLANGASTGADVAAAQPDHQRRLTTVGSATDIYTATGTSVATCAGVGQNLATREECETAAASLGFKRVLGTGGWDNAPPGCICEPCHYNCWFNTLSGGPAREDRFLVCKGTHVYARASFNEQHDGESRFYAQQAHQAWFYAQEALFNSNMLMFDSDVLAFYEQQASHNSDMLVLQQASNAQQASHNSDILALQQASNVQQALHNPDMLALQEASVAQQVAHQQASNVQQVAGLGPEFKTDNGHLVYPYAAILDSGTSGQTAFDFVGNTTDWPVDANGSRFYAFGMQKSSTWFCGEHCLARSAEVHGLVGYAYVAGLDYNMCLCQYDTAVAYPDSTAFDYTVTLGVAHLGTGRLRSGPQWGYRGGDDGPADAPADGPAWEIYERVYSSRL